MKLILARHGETEENEKEIFQGQLHGVLTEKGKEQARELSEKLKDERIDIIYSSDLDRARDTAEFVAKEYPSLKIKLVKDLRERFLGEFEGKKKSEFGLKKEDAIKEDYIAKLGDTSVEKLNDFYDRAKRFLKKLLKEYPDKTVLCVSHSGISRAMIAVINNKKPNEIEHLEKLPNAGYKIFEIKEGSID